MIKPTEADYTGRDSNGCQQGLQSPHTEHPSPEHHQSICQYNLGEGGTVVECIITYKYKYQ